MWAAGCQFCQISCRRSFHSRSLRWLTPPLSLQVPTLSAMLCVLGTVHQPHARSLDHTHSLQPTLATPPPLKSSFKKLEGSRFLREREYGKYSIKGLEKPEVSPDTGIVVLCDLSNHSPLSGLQLPPCPMFVE